ncbi:MAG: hypothetical protein LQ352_007469 [Teloschistes flavicans]|nr:MAG: hypothetical protein LQ352_007469 [Teloschistes flavicans]
MASSITSLLAPSLSHTVSQKPTATAASGSRVAHQGGILEGSNPSKYDPKNPIIIFIIQAGIIIIFCRILHFPLSKIRQPRVIAEIIGGILLGPSVFGRIPGFTNAIFPTASIPALSLAANLGLVLFLFLVGLEVDMRLLVSNWRIALSVGAAGMALPFGLGCAIAYGLYHQFRTESGLVPISFGTYMLFVGVAMAITAFPVLCRILTELQLLQDRVGVVVLSAGVGNDVIGWILLALCVALVNAGSGISALYVLLTSVAYVLFLVYAIRPLFLWILRKTGSIQNGPSQPIVGLTVLMILASAFFTGIIGVHPIFGAFLVGLICPHDGGFAIKLTEKIEDLVTVFFLPLYFALSGLSTNIGLLDSGITWAYVIGVIAVAFVGKFVGGTIAARLCKMVWRESFTVGVMMSCKGLVELIVLVSRPAVEYSFGASADNTKNIGLQARILSQRTFTIFVVMALVTTFATTPLTIALYPPWYRKKMAAWRRGDIDWDGNDLSQDSASMDAHTIGAKESYASEIRRLLVYLRLESLPSLFAFVSLFSDDRPGRLRSRVHPSRITAKADDRPQGKRGDSQEGPLQIHGLRMLQLTERLSSVMKDSEIGDVSTKDPVVNSFHSFGQLKNLAVSGDVEIVPEGCYVDELNRAAVAQGSDMVLLPWSENGSLSETENTTVEDSKQHVFEEGAQSQFIASFLTKSPCQTAIFINNGFGSLAARQPGNLTRRKSKISLGSSHGLPSAAVIDRHHHVFFPFYGGPDDRAAMRLVLRLARNPDVTATILFVNMLDPWLKRGSSGEATPNDPSDPSSPSITSVDITEAQITFFKQEKAFWLECQYALPVELASRVLFDTMLSQQPLQDTLARAQAEVASSAAVHSAGDLIVLGRGSGSVCGFRPEMLGLLRQARRSKHAGSQCLGEAAQMFIGMEVEASLLIVRAGRHGNGGGDSDGREHV